MSQNLTGGHSPADEKPPPLLLHVFNSFGCGGAQTRFVQLANHFGPLLRHIVVARDGDYAGTRQLEPGTQVTPYPWRESGASLPQQLRSIANIVSAIRPTHLLTHNWGTMNWVMANLAGRVRHIHIEDGFGPDEATRLKGRRVIARRILLQRSDVVVPSLTLQRIAKTRWKISSKRLFFIPNGIDCTRFEPRSGDEDRSRDGVPRIGTVAALRPEKNFARLLRAFALVLRQRPSRLIIVGDGPERSQLQSQAAALGIQNWVEFAGHIDDPVGFYQRFDVFALTSDTEQMPYTVLEAMAGSLPVVSTDVGDIRSMVSSENAPLIVDRDDEKVAAAILRAIEDQTLSRQAGTANRRAVMERFDQSAMFGAFAKLYGLSQAKGQDAFRGRG